MLSENMIPFKYTFKVIPNSILWLQAKPISQTKNYIFSNEFALVYINCKTFEKGYTSGQLQKQMKQLKEFVSRAKQGKNELQQEE